MESAIIKCGRSDCSARTQFELDEFDGSLAYPANWNLWYESGFLEARCPRHRKNTCDEEGSH